MLRHPVQLTSLEEDFKRLGLLQEDAVPAPQLKPAPPGVPAPNKNGSRNVGAQTDGDTDEGEDGNDTVPGHQGEPTGSGPAKPALPTTPGAQKESISGGDSRRQRLRGESSKKDDDDEDDDEEEDDEEEEQDESVELEGSSAVQESINRLRGGKTESRRSSRTSLKESTHSGRLDKVAAMMEDVNSIMESIDNTRKEDAVRAFANAAIISEMLSKGFEHFAVEYDDKDFQETAQAFSTMSEDAAAVAHALEEGEEIDGEALQNEFRAQMDGLMEGLDLYSDIIEADSEIEEEEGLDEEEEVDEETEDSAEDDLEEEEEVDEETEGDQEEASSMSGSSYRPKFSGKKKPGGHVGTWSTGAKKESSMSGSSYRPKFTGKKKAGGNVGTWSTGAKAQNMSRDEERQSRATGGIVSQATTESYFRQGKMGPSGKKTAGSR